MSGKNWSTYKRESEERLQQVNSYLNPGEKKGEGNEKPYYASGARCFIKMGGQPLGICQDFKWNVSYAAEPTKTIDTVFPWDIEVGQVNISATLSRIVDPLRGPEADNLFAVMAAAIHQPMVELQVIYNAKAITTKRDVKQIENAKVVTREKSEDIEFSMFFARGMFTGMSGNATVGQLSSMSLTFQGVAYQNYVSQSFTPYGAGYKAQELIELTGSLTSSVTGGFF